jgi:nucleotide-binding universal stress UspA family protein
MYKHLFVPVDGSELSHRAMDGSIELAKQLGAQITGFVVEPDLPITAATTHGDQFIGRLKDNESKNEAHASALLLLRPCEVLSGVSNPTVLEVAHNPLRGFLQHRHMLVGGLA